MKEMLNERLHRVTVAVINENGRNILLGLKYVHFYFPYNYPQIIQLSQGNFWENISNLFENYRLAKYSITKFSLPDYRQRNAA